jgi:hypothetical protein
VSVLPPAQQQALARQDAHFLAIPLQTGPSPHSMAAHLRKITRLLRNHEGPSPCSDVMAHLNGLYDRSVPPEPAIACRKGCSHCCTQQVAVSAPEAFFLAAQLRGDPRGSAMAAVALQLGGAALGQENPHGIACALLDAQGACSLYAARPLGCHAFVSLRLEACLAAFVEGALPDIPMPQAHVTLLYMCRMMLTAALRLAGLDEATYEMNAAVCASLAQPDSERRWFAGVDIFAGLARSPTPPPHVGDEIARMATFVAPTV